MFINPASRGFRVVPEVITKQPKIRVKVVHYFRLDVSVLDGPDVLA